MQNTWFTCGIGCSYKMGGGVGLWNRVHIVVTWGLRIWVVVK